MDKRDWPRLPDEWGYDYARRRFMSPLMFRSLLLAAFPTVVLFGIVLIVELVK